MSTNEISASTGNPIMSALDSIWKSPVSIEERMLTIRDSFPFTTRGRWTVLAWGREVKRITGRSVKRNMRADALGQDLLAFTE